MSFSLHDQRFRFFLPGMTTDDAGRDTTGYAVVSSGEPDHAHWCRVEDIGAGASMVAQQKQVVISKVLHCSDEISGLQGMKDGIVQMYPTLEIYKVVAVRSSRATGELLVDLLEVGDEVYGALTGV